MSNGTALATQNDINLEELQRTAAMLVASGYFDAKGERSVQIAQIATKIMAGRELGYGPFASVQGIHVIQGKPQISSNLMAAAVKSHPRYGYKIRKMDHDVVSIEFFEHDESLGTSTFTLEDAKRAGTQNLQKYPRNMLFARALSNGVRWFCPDVFHGQAVYVEGEIESTVENEPPAYVVVDRDTGEVIEGEVVPPVTPAPATNGNGSKPEPTISAAQLKMLHSLGKKVYGTEWDDKRTELVMFVTKQRTSSSKDLTVAEATKLLDGLRDKAAELEEPDLGTTTEDDVWEGAGPHDDVEAEPEPVF